MSVSTILGITEISATQANKHTTHNNAVTALEEAANAIHTNSSVGAGPVTITEAQATRNQVFVFSGASSAADIKFPSTINSNNTERVFVVRNADTVDTLTIKASTGSGASVAIGPSQAALLYQNFEDVYVLARSGATTVPYDLGFFLPGQPDDGGLVMQFRAVRAFTIPDNFAGSYGYCSINPTATAAFDVLVNGSSIGSISISTGGTFTFNTTGGAASIAAGDRISVTAPTPQDATLENVSVNILGERTV